MAVEETFEKGVEVAELPSLEEMLPDMIRETAELIKQDAETAFLNRCEIESALLSGKESIQLDSSSTTPATPTVVCYLFFFCALLLVISLESSSYLCNLFICENKCKS